MTRTLAAVALALSMLVLGGCANECQQLCTEMGKYWEECGLNFGDAEVSECRKSFRGGTGSAEEPTAYGQHRAACRQLTGTEENEDGEKMVALRARFTCEDMAEGPGGAFSETDE